MIFKEKKSEIILFVHVLGRSLMPVAAGSKAWACARSLGGIVGSNSAAGWIYVS
jgi:hypothetical protein